jgi:hypothetical protein
LYVGCYDSVCKRFTIKALRLIAQSSSGTRYDITISSFNASVCVSKRTGERWAVMPVNDDHVFALVNVWLEQLVTNSDPEGLDPARCFAMLFNNSVSSAKLSTFFIDGQTMI